MSRFGIKRGNDQHRLLAADQQQPQKTLMRITGKSGQIVHMLRIGDEQRIQAPAGHSLLQSR
ncbi:hypothetical protein D3C85_1638870 [compost metagenome]